MSSYELVEIVGVVMVNELVFKAVTLVYKMEEFVRVQ